MGRSPCCSKEGLNRGAWTALEDKILKDYIKVHGEGRWRNLPKKAGLKRCGKSCRLRWLNYLRPDIKRGNISSDEEELIVRLHRLLGNRWSLIAGRLPGRTDNEIKNYWNTNLGKKVMQGQSKLNSTLKKQQQQQQQQQQLKKKKKKPMNRPAIEVAPQPKNESHVVRTKAMRCTKVILNTPKQPQQQIEHFDTNGVLAPAMVGDFANYKVIESESCGGSSLFTPGGGEDSCSDFMMDLNMGELCLSELLDSNFNQLCNFDNVIGDCNNGDNNNNNNNDNEFSPSSDQQQLLFTEDLLEDLKGCNGVQLDGDSDLRSFDWFLDSEEDWLGES